ncbi:MAG: hypothetical protein LBH43_14780, partial [Treponema sp.]|nr:hypothetical protein [Treponema sp.]
HYSNSQLKEDYCRVANKRTYNKDSYQELLIDFQTSEKPIQPSENIQMRIEKNREEDDDDSRPSSSFSFCQIQEISKSLGFAVSPEQAKDFISNLPDETWLEGEFNFLVYAAEKVHRTEKPRDEQARLFVKTWKHEFCIQEYPDWRAAAEKEAEEMEKRHRVDRARSDGPKTCGNCGTAVSAPEGLRGSCPSCGYVYIFDEGQVMWQFTEPITLAKEFEKMYKEKNNA